MHRRSATTVAVLTAAVVALPSIAQAKWSATGNGSPAVGAATMRNATRLTSMCAANTSGSVINLAWTPSTDPIVNAYRITRTGTNGGTSGVINISGRATASVTDSPPTGAGFAYTYSIRAGNQTTFAASNWTTVALPAAAGVSYTGGAGGNKCV